MKQYLIDFTEANTYVKLYECLIRGLELPEWCGKNPDAIWDLLVGCVEYPATITFFGLNNVSKELGNEMQIITEMFDELVSYYEDGRVVVIKQ